ncbi:methionine--tRNA ligase subunit beta, partial [Candidatus Poribacteria bacterium]|nr:methionine--tRNA ligase subunit beta [Candidatus Poribacteria bacterium]
PKAAKPNQNSQEKKSNLISLADFQKQDLRVGCVTSAESIEGADRLLKLQVDLGTEKRQVVAGIAEHYQPDTLVGRQVIVVVNLEPATIRNVESHGMILAASGDAVVLASPETEVPLGTQVR